MATFKTVKSEGAIQRVLNGQLRVCSVDNDKNYEVELLLINSLPNRNNWRYTDLEAHLDDVEDTPILFSHTQGNHAFTVKTDEKTGKEYASFVDADSEKPVGWIPKTIRGEKNARIVNIDGVDWLSARGILPKFYNKELIDELESNNGKMDISVETLVYENHYEGEVEVETKWVLTGTTILKQGVAPAVKGANISRKVNAMGEQLADIKLRVASLVAETHIEPQTQTKNSKKGENRTMAEENKAVATDLTNSVSEPAVETETVETLKAKLNASNAALETLTAENAKLNEQIKAMREAEMERRKNAVKDAIKARLLEISENCDIAENECDDLLTDEKVSEYATCEKDGIFCGEEMAKRDVDARCMAKVLAEKKAQVKNNQFTWSDGVRGVVAEQEVDEIEKSLKNIMK